MKLLKFILAGTIMLSIASCKDDKKDDFERTDPSKGGNVVSSKTVEANRFVYEIMTDYYYWYSYMPSLDYKTQTNTEEYFEKLKYSGDRFSFITDDAEGYFKEESGISTSKGFNQTFMLYKQGEERVVTMINYVYHGTPAEEAGAKRGDIIVAIDGKEQNLDNYYELFSQPTATYTAKRYDKETDGYIDVEYTITAQEISVSPVAEVSVFDTEVGKVGYLLYLDYYSAFNDELTAAFAKFKEEGVNELILDLRYNTGGEMTAMQRLCSLIAPKANVEKKDLLIWYDFNDKLKKYDSYSKDKNATYFDSKVANNSLDLNRIVIITGSSTYSASESTIIGLAPYMDVYTIGNTTGGKNTSMFIMTPEDFQNSQTNEPYFDKAINNWLIAPIVAVYYNADNYTFDPANGIDPDTEMDEYGADNMGTLGKTDEPLTAAAIEYIETGAISTEGNKSVKATPTIIKHDTNVGRSIIERPQINR